MINNKDTSIETLRGTAIFFVVTAHIIGFNKSFGMTVEDDSLLRYFYYSLKFLRIPLFTAISGYVYAWRPLLPGNERTFITGKSRRLLLPLAIGVLIKYSFNIIVNRYETVPIEQFWRLFLFPFGHLWYLQALFLVFLWVAVLERLHVFRSVKMWAICLVAAFGMTWFSKGFPDFFSFDNFPYLLFFFLLGFGINRFSRNLYLVKFIIPVILIFITCIALQQLAWLTTLGLSTYYKSLLGLITGASGTFLLFHYRRPIPLMAKLGHYSYSIYLYHLIGTTGSRLILISLGIENNVIIFSTGLFFGLFVPIGIEHYLDDHNWLRLVLLGKRK